MKPNLKKSIVLAVLVSVTGLILWLWPTTIFLSIVTALIALVAVCRNFIEDKEKGRKPTLSIILLAFTLLSGFGGIAMSRRESKETREAKARLERLQRSQEEAVANAKDASAKLDDQRKISIALSQELGFVRRELEIERRVAYKGVVHWGVAIHVPTPCFGEYATEASARRNDAGERIEEKEESDPAARARRLTEHSLGDAAHPTELPADRVTVLLPIQSPPERWHYEFDPNRLPISDYCREEVIRLLNTIHVHVIFQNKRVSDSSFLNKTFVRALLKGESIRNAFAEAHASNKGAWFFTINGDARHVVGVSLEEETNRARIRFEDLLKENDLRTADGTLVSTLEVGGANGFAMVHRVEDEEIERMRRTMYVEMGPTVWAPSLELKWFNLELNNQPINRQPLSLGAPQVAGVGGPLVPSDMVDSPPEFRGVWYRLR